MPKILSWLLGGLKPVATLACNVVSGLRDQIAAGKSIRPDVAELIEVIEAPARYEIQSAHRRDARLQESGGLFGFVADERRLRTEGLRDEGPLLSGIDLTVERARRERQPTAPA